MNLNKKEVDLLLVSLNEYISTCRKNVVHYKGILQHQHRSAFMTARYEGFIKEAEEVKKSLIRHRDGLQNSSDNSENIKAKCLGRFQITNWLVYNIESPPPFIKVFSVEGDELYEAILPATNYSTVISKSFSSIVLAKNFVRKEYYSARVSGRGAYFKWEFISEAFDLQAESK